jgi:hypothetical protein
MIFVQSFWDLSWAAPYLAKTRMVLLLSFKVYKNKILAINLPGNIKTQ